MKRRLTSAFFIGLISLFITACGEDNLPEYIQLGGLRVLALEVNAGGFSEVAAGSTVTVVPFISAIDFAGTISYSAQACLDPGLGFGAEPSCVGVPGAVTLASGAALALPGVANDWTGAADSFNVNIPSSGVIFAGKSAQDQYNGVSYLVTYELQDSSGRQVKSFRRIIVSTKSPKNQNPSSVTVLANGSAFISYPLSTSVDLSISISGVGAENFSEQLSDGSFRSRTEEITTTWFISDGEMKFFRTLGGDVNQFTGPASLPTGRKAYVIAVTRDGRGGVVVTQQAFP
ncbi:MAG: hypothetical protein ACK5RO_04570 [Pseudobdellovibrionaceae bacterium]